LAPPIAWREASKTERTSFTVCAAAVPVVGPKKARPRKAEKAATLCFMWFSCAFREVILSYKSAHELLL
jgi:hypothetical protein